MNTTEYLQKHREAPEASRRVQGNRGNRTGRVMSSKMGHSIDFESASIERAVIHLFEHSDDIKEFYAQPQPVRLALPDKNGQMRTLDRTFDYLSVDSYPELTLSECKMDAEMEELARENPHRWVKGKDGKWRSPVTEQALAELGIRYLLITDADFTPQYIANLEYLSACALRVDHPTKLHREIESTIKCGAKTIEALCKQFNCAAHDVLEAYQLGLVFIDLEACFLGRPDIAIVCSSQLVAEAYKHTAKTRIPARGAAIVEAGDVISFDGTEFEVDVVADDTIYLLSRDGKKRLKQYSKENIRELLAQNNVTLLKEANTANIKAEVKALIQKACHKTLQKALNKAACARGDLELEGVSQRTKQRWAKRRRESLTFYGVDFAGFLEPVRQGFRGRKMPDETYEVMREVMQDEYLTKQCPSVNAAYSILLDICKERGIHEPSYNSFKHFIEGNTTEAERLRKRLNRRAAYSITSGSGTLYDPHYLGEYAWHRAHIDAKQVDLSTICPRTGKPIGKVWMTLVLAPKVRMVLGYALTYEPPSANTTMLALRDVYQQWGAMPNEIVMDNGKEFKNLAISRLLAAFGTNVTYRPPANPRHGSIIERFFGVFDKRFAHLLKGSTHALSRETGVNKENNPNNNACWDLGNLDEAIREFFDLYHDQMHPSLHMTPNEAMEADMRMHPTGKEIEL